jgi:hypothetical protein
MCRPMAKIGTYRTALFVAVFLLIAITVFWLQLSNQINVKEWQILIGFGGTLFVGWIAWENVDRQLKVQRAANRMTVLFVRRIGRSELPGLRATERMCAELFYCAKRAREYSADNNILRKILIDLGITGTTNERSKSKSPCCFRGQMFQPESRLRTATTILAHGESEERDRLLDKIIESIERNLESIMQSFALRIGRLEKRQDHIRRSIDDFFGDQ